MFFGLSGLSELISHSVNPVVRIETALDKSLKVTFEEMNVRRHPIARGGGGGCAPHQLLLPVCTPAAHRASTSRTCMSTRTRSC